MSPTPITLQTRVRHAFDISFTKAQTEMLAIDEQAGYYYVLNQTSGRVWELIAESDTAHGTLVTVEDICERLCREFSVDTDTCQREVIHLLQDLQEAGLVKVDD